jgi:hypothetical protein
LLLSKCEPAIFLRFTLQSAGTSATDQKPIHKTQFSRRAGFITNSNRLVCWRVKTSVVRVVGEQRLLMGQEWHRLLLVCWQTDTSEISRKALRKILSVKRGQPAHKVLLPELLQVCQIDGKIVLEVSDRWNNRDAVGKTEAKAERLGKSG